MYELWSILMRSRLTGCLQKGVCEGLTFTHKSLPYQPPEHIGTMVAICGLVKCLLDEKMPVAGVVWCLSSALTADNFGITHYDGGRSTLACTKHFQFNSVSVKRFVKRWVQNKENVRKTSFCS